MRELWLAEPYDGCFDDGFSPGPSGQCARVYLSIMGRLWNYNPLNYDTLGDDWNGENFSWFSERRALPTLLNYTQESPTLDNRARILETVVRPYPAKTAGIPLRFKYEVSCRKFVFERENDTNRKLAKGANGPPARCGISLQQQRRR